MKFHLFHWNGRVEFFDEFGKKTSWKNSLWTQINLQMNAIIPISSLWCIFQFQTTRFVIWKGSWIRAVCSRFPFKSIFRISEKKTYEFLNSDKLSKAANQLSSSSVFEYQWKSSLPVAYKSVRWIDQLLIWTQQNDFRKEDLRLKRTIIESIPRIKVVNHKTVGSNQHVIKSRIPVSYRSWISIDLKNLISYV